MNSQTGPCRGSSRHEISIINIPGSRDLERQGKDRKGQWIQVLNEEEFIHCI